MLAGCDHWLQQCDTGAVPEAELCSQGKNRVNSENKTIFTFFHLVHVPGELELELAFLATFI